MADASTVPEFRSPGDIRRYVENIAARKVEDDAAVRFWRAAKQATLMLVLAASFLIYHLLGVVEQVLAMPRIEVHVPHVAKTASTGSGLPH